MTSTINKEEIQKFSKLADEWWDVNGKFKPLHMFNPIRIEYILDEISKHFQINREKKNLLHNLDFLIKIFPKIKLLQYYGHLLNLV